jgi:hypothetical protein
VFALHRDWNARANPYLALTRKVTHILLTLAVIGLGPAMDPTIVAKVALGGIG